MLSMILSWDSSQKMWSFSVSRSSLEFLTKRQDLTEPTLDVKMAVAEGTATQLGWLAFETFVFLVAEGEFVGGHA